MTLFSIVKEIKFNVVALMFLFLLQTSVIYLKVNLVNRSKELCRSVNLQLESQLILP